VGTNGPEVVQRSISVGRESCMGEAGAVARGNVSQIGERGTQQGGRGEADMRQRAVLMGSGPGDGYHSIWRRLCTASFEK